MESNYFNQEEPRLVVDNATKENFKSIAGWGKFMAIAGIITTALLVIIGLISATALSAVYSTAMGSFMGFIIAALYIFIAALYVYPIYSLYKFSSLSKQAMINDDSIAFHASIVHLKNLFKYIGILTLVILGIYVLCIIVFIITISLSGMHR